MDLEGFGWFQNELQIPLAWTRFEYFMVLLRMLECHDSSQSLMLFLPTA